MDSQNSTGRSMRGFASMNKEKQKEIASKGGRAAHEKGTAHEFDSQEASQAAKKGHERGTAHEFTPDEARIAGRKGGMARAQNRAKGSVVPASASADGSPAPSTSNNQNPPDLSAAQPEIIADSNLQST